MKFAVLRCVFTGGVTPAYSCHEIARMSEAFGEVLHSVTHESLPFNFFNIGSNDCSKLFSEGGEGAGRGGVRDGALVCPVARTSSTAFLCYCSSRTGDGRHGECFYAKWHVVVRAVQFPQFGEDNFLIF